MPQAQVAPPVGKYLREATIIHPPVLSSLGVPRGEGRVSLQSHRLKLLAIWEHLPCTLADFVSFLVSRKSLAFKALIDSSLFTALATIQDLKTREANVNLC